MAVAYLFTTQYTHSTRRCNCQLWCRKLIVIL